MKRCFKMYSSFQGVLLDISGVLKDGNTVIPGSVAAFEKLKSCGMKVKLVTNETQETRSSIVTSLSFLGYKVEESDIIPPIPTLVNILKKRKLRPHLLVHPNVLQEFNCIDQSNPNCVVVGDAGDQFTYESLNEAFRILIQSDEPKLFSLGHGKYYRDGERRLVLDVGAFARCLEYAADVQAEIIGKPESSYFNSALAEMGIRAEHAIMIGDDVVSDVGGAQNCGLLGVLVRTGKYRPSDENHPYVKPDIVVNNLKEAVEFIVGSA